MSAMKPSKELVEDALKTAERIHLGYCSPTKPHTSTDCRREIEYDASLIREFGERVARLAAGVAEEYHTGDCECGARIEANILVRFGLTEED